MANTATGVVEQKAMRNGQQHHHNKRMRGRNNNNNNNNNRRSHNPLTRVYESNGPDVKIRGTANHVAEKYLQLARDAQSSGDPVSAENYFQHAEHYFRLIAAAQEQFRQNNPNFQPRPEGGGNDQQFQSRQDENFENQDDDSQPFAETPFGTREPQPYLPREAQPFPNQPPQQQHAPRQHQPAGPDSGDVDRLPSFITGGQPQNAGGQQAGQGQNGHDGQPDRFPLHRRRRRHRGPRPDLPGGPRDDASPQD